MPGGAVAGARGRWRRGNAPEMGPRPVRAGLQRLVLLLRAAPSHFKALVRVAPPAAGGGCGSTACCGCTPSPMPASA